MPTFIAISFIAPIWPFESRRMMRIHDVIRTTAHALERQGRHFDVDAILAQFPDREAGDEKVKWNLCERIESSFTAQLDKQRDYPFGCP
jgi:hypothetical protein